MQCYAPNTKRRVLPMRNMALVAALENEVCRDLLQIALGVKFRRQKFNAISPNTHAVNLKSFCETSWQIIGKTRRCSADHSIRTAWLLCIERSFSGVAYVWRIISCKNKAALVYKPSILCRGSLLTLQKIDRAHDCRTSHYWLTDTVSNVWMVIRRVLR